MLLVGVNAKYIHSNLAIRYLAQVDSRCNFQEFTIQDRAEHIAASLFETGERVFCFSCYIWNIDIIYQVCEILKKADSGLVLGLAGPEVSFDPEEQLFMHPFLSFILCGEGESALSHLLDALEEGTFERVPGLWYRTDDGIFKSEVPSREADLDSLPFAYTEADIKALKNRIVYFETSRGCPYRCAFCLSGSAGTLRYLPLDKVEKAIAFFARYKVPLVKLVDRTFNADPQRALSIIEMIKSHGGGTTYHFEIRAEAMTEPLIRSLQEAPKGMFQLEIGVQSVNETTLRNINRRPAFLKLCEVTEALQAKGNMHIHLDLIAGLPGESLDEFIHSFNQVFALRPQMLQLGFLKRLKGAELMAPGSHFCDFPPYEVIHSDKMTYGELLHLKAVEEILEQYYNSGLFETSLSYVLKTYYAGREFDFFSEMAGFVRQNDMPKGHKALYEALCCFEKEKFGDNEITHRIIYDYCLRHRDSLSFMENGDRLKAAAFEFLKQPERVKLYFAHYAGEKPVTLYKKIRFMPIGDRIVAFDVSHMAAADVTKEFE
ncbi:MAG: DUF4080 domain-containing protein [Clostridia bacterium]|nr:DUF4080 domain-containing protein [Clostridia bacterium]